MHLRRLRGEDVPAALSGDFDIADFCAQSHKVGVGRDSVAVQLVGGRKTIRY